MHIFVSQPWWFNCIYFQKPCWSNTYTPQMLGRCGTVSSQYALASHTSAHWSVKHTIMKLTFCDGFYPWWTSMGQHEIWPFMIGFTHDGHQWVNMKYPYVQPGHKVLYGFNQGLYGGRSCQAWQGNQARRKKWKHIWNKPLLFCACQSQIAIEEYQCDLYLITLYILNCFQAAWRYRWLSARMQYLHC